MNSDEIRAEAWKIMLSGAEGHSEDWIDENDDYSEEDGELIFRAQMDMVYALRKQPPIFVEIERKNDD